MDYDFLYATYVHENRQLMREYRQLKLEYQSIKKVYDEYHLDYRGFQEQFDELIKEVHECRTDFREDLLLLYHDAWSNQAILVSLASVSMCLVTSWKLPTRNVKSRSTQLSSVT